MDYALSHANREVVRIGEIIQIEIYYSVQTPREYRKDMRWASRRSTWIVVYASEADRMVKDGCMGFRFICQ